MSAISIRRTTTILKKPKLVLKHFISSSSSSSSSSSIFTLLLLLLLLIINIINIIVIIIIIMLHVAAAMTAWLGWLTFAQVLFLLTLMSDKWQNMIVWFFEYRYSWIKTIKWHPILLNLLMTLNNRLRLHQLIIVPWHPPAVASQVLYIWIGTSFFLFRKW